MTEPERHLRILLGLILDDMPTATNRDLACDGPVGNEEGEVWARIELRAREAQEFLSGVATGGDSTQ